MTNYRRFMILSTPRSGTHMLRTSLDAHPNIVCMTEMFNPDYTLDKYDFTEDTPEREILDKFIFHDYDEAIAAVGFGLHRRGARFGNWPDLWRILEEDRDLAIISLTRDNLLRRYWSFQLRRYQNLKDSPPEPMQIDAEELDADFRRQSEAVAVFDRRFSGHAVVRVTYEQLCSNYASTLEEIQTFLGVPLVQLQPGTDRRHPMPMTNWVTNYEQLKRHFASTCWASFFDE